MLKLMLKFSVSKMPFPTISVELFSINKCDGKCSSYLFIDLTYLSSLQQKKGKKSFFFEISATYNYYAQVYTTPLFRLHCAN